MKKIIPIFVMFIILVIIIIIGESDLNPNYQKSDYTPKTMTVSGEKETKSYSGENLYVYANQNNIGIYIKGSVENSDRYIRYQLSNSSKDLDRDVNNSNFNVWTLTRADEYQRIRESKFSKVRQVVNQGEWEFAIKENGANDFVGGVAHGDEITTSFKMSIDGEEIDLIKGYNDEAKEMTFITESDLYRDNTITENLEKIGTHYKKYTFNKDGLTIEQEVVFDEGLILDRSYLAMLPIFRQNDVGEQITDTVYIGEEKIQQDITTNEFDIELFEANQAIVSGEDRGITARVEILDKSTNVPTDFFVSNAPQYNKLYFAYVSDGYKVNAGERWGQTTHYVIDTKN